MPNKSSDDYLGNNPDHRQEHDFHVALVMLALAVLVIVAGVILAVITGGAME